MYVSSQIKSKKQHAPVYASRLKYALVSSLRIMPRQAPGVGSSAILVLAHAGCARIVKGMDSAALDSARFDTSDSHFSPPFDLAGQVIAELPHGLV